MPKAYDDETEFASETAVELVQLSTRERLFALLSGKYVALSVALFAGIFSLISAFLTVSNVKSVPDAPFAKFGQEMTRSAVTIGRAHNEIRQRLQSIPDSDAKKAIVEQLDIINREATGLKAYGDSLQHVEKRSGISFFSVAYAQSGPPHLTADDVRLYGIVAILVVLGIAFLLCIGIILFSDHARRLTFAIDTVKVLMGFFVGVATSFFGVR